MGPRSESGFVFPAKAGRFCKTYNRTRGGWYESGPSDAPPNRVPAKRFRPLAGVSPGRFEPIGLAFAVGSLPSRPAEWKRPIHPLEIMEKDRSMEARISRAALLAAVLFVSMGASYRTPNFVVET